MRLINCKTRQFEEFFDQDIPRYAILSHTWDGAEVPFKDYHHPERHTLYSVDANNKIEQTCQKAKEDGFDYVWIDSCNIDKSSSAELTEAINSMYKWYEGAERCYIYLSDLSLDVETFEQIRDYKESCKPYLANCKWFARGWVRTLQELIAPVDARFLDNTWREFGSRSELVSCLVEITSIPYGVLRRSGNFKTRHYSVAQRMSWAAKRHTTRSEDIAYCLFGLFDVNLPLLYGEGGTKAFMRLQEQIMKDTNDLTLFAWTSETDWDTTSHGILAQSPRDFSKAGYTETKGLGTFKSPRIGSNPEFSMTNKGLRIQTTLAYLGLNKSRPEYFMPLNCDDIITKRTLCEPNNSSIGILISEYADPGIFHRMHPSWLGKVGDGARWLEKSGEIYIAK